MPVMCQALDSVLYQCSWKPHNNPTSVGYYLHSVDLGTEAQRLDWGSCPTSHQHCRAVGQGEGIQFQSLQCFHGTTLPPQSKNCFQHRTCPAAQETLPPPALQPHSCPVSLTGFSIIFGMAKNTSSSQHSPCLRLDLCQL